MGESEQYIYLDYAATSPLCEEARLAVRPFFHASGTSSVAMRGNANTLYTPGRFAFSKLEEARLAIASAIGAKHASEIVFTSGATESVFLALSGIYSANGCKEIIVSQIEHACVIQAAFAIAGKENVILLKPNKFGFIEDETLEEAISTCKNPLVSIQFANSEIGSIQNIEKLCSITKSKGAIFHSDITQAVGKIEVDLGRLGIDSASFSSHKLGGPFGVGALYLSKGLKFKSMIKGGGQEEGRRGGTQNVAGAVGFAAAVRASVSNVDSEAKRLGELKAQISEGISQIKSKKNSQFCKLTVDESGAQGHYLPNISHITLPDIESEVAILRFDESKICVSGGSACSASSSGPSKVLLALSKPVDEAICALRVSTGRYTTQDEIYKFLGVLEKVIS